MNETITISLDDFIKNTETNIKMNIILDMIRNDEPDYRVCDIIRRMYGEAHENSSIF